MREEISEIEASLKKRRWRPGNATIAVVGSRKFDDYPRLCRILDEILSVEIGVRVTIISGGAKGADTLAEKYAMNNGIEFRPYPARWKDFSAPCKIKQNSYGKYNSLAGVRRNMAMAHAADLVVAFWNGKSRGTKQMIEYSRKIGVEVTVINI